VKRVAAPNQVRGKLTLKLLLGLCAISFCGCEIGYIAHGAYAEARLLWNRRPIEQVLEKRDLKPEIRDKLQMVLQVRRFAEDRLGENVGGSYTTVTPVEQWAVTWVLMAAQPDQLKPYTWCFPIVGSVPYKGYFSKSAALAAAKSMEDQGYDTFVRPAVAFSSLGYFNDPLLSNLLELNHVVLAGVIIHELFHRTYFLASNVMFDESSANYVGGRGAMEFFKYLEGPDSQDVAVARAVVQSDMLFGEFLKNQEAKLQALYHSGKPRAEILKQRVGVFHEIQSDYAKLKPRLSGLDRFDLDQIKLNNAVLINYQLYFHHLEDFAALDALHGCDLRQTISTIINLAKGNPDDPFGAIHRAVRAVPLQSLTPCAGTTMPVEAERARR